jgi:outer membrane protein assembly factor BamB
MKSLAFSITTVTLVASLQAQIYQFRGPERDGKFPETNLMKEWPEEGPGLLVEYEGIGEGWSSVVSNGKYIYATGKIGEMDHLTCIDFDGHQKWQVAYGQSWDASHPNTRSTPTLEGDRVYVTSGIGELVCINALTGDIHWKINVDRDYGAEWHKWGVAESPLIVDDKVICSPASEEATFVAFDKITGEEVWKSPGTGGQRSYVSPVLANLHGNQYIIGASASDLFIVDPEKGDIRTSYRYFDPSQWKWQPEGMIWANSPVVHDNMIFIAIGYNYPAKMLRVNEEVSSIEEVYTNKEMDNHHHGMVYLDGYLYGSTWIHNNAGNWACLDWESGEVAYEEKWNSKGQMVYADGMLYVYVEKGGHVGLVEPDPSGFEVISSFQVEKGRGQHWAHPFLNDGKLFLRHGEVLMVYDISKGL